MLNIYGEKVILSKAQEHEYIALLNGPITVHFSDKKVYKTYEILKEKGLIKVVYVFANAARYARWM